MIFFRSYSGAQVIDSRWRFTVLSEHMVRDVDAGSAAMGVGILFWHDLHIEIKIL